MKSPTRSEFKALSSLFGNISVLALGSVVVPAAFLVDRIDWVMIVLGLGVSVFTAGLSLWSARKGKL